MKCLLYLLLLSPLNICAQVSANTIVISNPSKMPRPDELIVLSRQFITTKLGGGFGTGRMVRITKDGLPVLLQFDDLNKDGIWDEVAFQYSFKSKEKAVLTIYSGPGSMTKPVVRAHVRQRRKNINDTFGAALDRDSVPAGQPNADFSKQKLPPLLTEGPAWENDKVGFRIYMDVRNIKDIWGKTTPVMMMDTVGTNPKLIYHNLADWGMDILAVGKSLGAGSLALLVPVKGQKDTLVRLGGVNMGPVIYEKVADGPLRAIFRMHYPKWQVLDGLPPVSLTEEISIWGGQYFYQSKVTVKHALAGAKLVAGIVNLKSERSTIITAGACKALYTFAQQSENKDNLGLAVVVTDNGGVSFGETPKQGGDGVLSTYTVAVPVIKSMPVALRVYSAWEHSDNMFATEAGFSKYLANELQKYLNLLIIK